MIMDFSNPGLEKDLSIHHIRERESTNLFKKELETGANVLDIGSNIGYYALIEAKEVGEKGCVRAIEPVPENFETLEKNVELNQYDNIDCINKAAGSKDTEARIKKSPSPNRNRIDEKNEYNIVTEVETVDSLRDNIEPEMIRMDVEGYEIEIFKGMENVLKKDSLKLFLELHPRKIENFYGGNIKEIWEKLSENDFKIKYLVRHPSEAKLSYFFREEHAPRKVLNPDMPIYPALEEFSDFFEWESTFRIFLEKE